MIVELALATHTAPAQWRYEDDAVIVTALQVLKEIDAEVNKHNGR